MASLIELQAQANDAVALLATIDPDDIDSLALLEEQVQLLAQDARAKVDGWFLFVKRMEAEEAFNRNIANEHIQRAQAISSFLERLKKRLCEAHAIGILPEKMEGESKTIRFQKNSVPSVRTAEDLSLWDLDVDRRWQCFVKTTVELDKKAILDAYKAGEELPPGIEVVEGKHVRFEIKRSK